MASITFGLKRVALAAVLAGGLSACATAPEQDEQRAGDDLFGETAEVDDNDPIEPFNRYIFEVNLGLDKMMFRPLAEIYRVALPEIMRDSIRNFLDNFSAPVTMFNSLFQGDLDNAWNTAVRFGINSTAGVFGLFDFADGWGYPERSEDFGQTLGVWGAGEGPYIMLPIFGPSNARDGVGRAVDRFLNPIEWYLAGAPVGDFGGVAPSAPLSAAVVGGIDERSRNIETLDTLESNSLDFYATIRSLYRQRRDSAIANLDSSALDATGQSLAAPSEIDLMDPAEGDEDLDAEAAEDPQP